MTRLPRVGGIQVSFRSGVLSRRRWEVGQRGRAAGERASEEGVTGQGKEVGVWHERGKGALGRLSSVNWY